MADQHTPGPWSVRRAVTPDNTGGFDCAIVVDGDKIIAEAFQNVGYGDRGGYDKRPVAANARLIALSTVIPDLYASEINAKIDWFWDGGFEVAVGDDMNGWAESANVGRNWPDALEWLQATAIRHWPDSKFAQDRATLAKGS